MKGIRLKIMLLTALMLTICCGLLFYRSLHSLDTPRTAAQLDFDELRSLDLQINAEAFYLRKNINADPSDLLDSTSRIKEMLSLLKDMHVQSPEVNNTISKVKAHFETKEKQSKDYLNALKVLRTNVNQFLSLYGEISRNNLKFTLDKNDKRDFFRECLLDVYIYLSFSSRENEGRLLEDMKILSQVVNFAATPNPLLVNYHRTIENIHQSVKQTDKFIHNFKEQDIRAEMKLISRAYYEEGLAREKDNETFLKLVFASFVVYLIAMAIILKKN